MLVLLQFSFIVAVIVSILDHFLDVLQQIALGSTFGRDRGHPGSYSRVETVEVIWLIRFNVPKKVGVVGKASAISEDHGLLELFEGLIVLAKGKGPLLEVHEFGSSFNGGLKNIRIGGKIVSN